MKLPNSWPFWRMDAAAVAIVAGLTLIAWLIEISPTITRSEQARAEQRELVGAREEAHRLERSMLRAKDQLDKTAALISMSQVDLRPASELNQKLARLNELMAQHSLLVDGVESSAPSNSEHYSTVPIRIRGRGTYRNCALAIADLRATMRDTGIEGMRLTATGDTNDTIATFTFDVLWYTAPQPKVKKN